MFTCTGNSIYLVKLAYFSWVQIYGNQSSSCFNVQFTSFCLLKNRRLQNLNGFDWKSGHLDYLEGSGLWNVSCIFYRCIETINLLHYPNTKVVVKLIWHSVSLQFIVTYRIDCNKSAWIHSVKKKSLIILNISASKYIPIKRRMTRTCQQPRMD